MTMMTKESLNGSAEPDWAYPRIEPVLRKGEVRLARRALEPGEAWESDQPQATQPMTPSADARDLPKYGVPMRQLPVREWTSEFPHGWIDYEDMHAATGPDLPPRPQGWASPGPIDERAVSVEMVGPKPWCAEEDMANDVSGMGQFDLTKIGTSFSNIFGSLFGGSDDEEIAATEQKAGAAVTEEASKAEAEGKSPGIVQSIVDIGSQFAALYLQKRALDKTEDIAADERAAAEAKLASERLRIEQAGAQAGVDPATLKRLQTGVGYSEAGPWYTSPFAIIGGILGAGIIGFAAYKAMSR